MQPSRLNFFSGLLLVLTLAGCVPSGIIKEPEPERPAVDPLATQALSLEQAGDFLGAASLYERLAAEGAPPARQEMLLRAADAYLKGGDPEQAARLLSLVESQGLPSVDFHRRIIAAEVALGRNRPDESLALLSTPIPEGTPEALLLRYHTDRAEGFRLAGNLLESARELGELDLKIMEHGARLENQTAIIQTLAALTDTALELLQPIPPGIQGGWMELTRIIKRHTGDNEEMQTLFTAWRERFPNHPAMPELLDGYFEKLKAQYRRPNHLAILLPDSGPYADAASALKQGFMAAYYQHPLKSRPSLAFYDTSNSEDTWPLYRKAVDAGAEMVIGPLNKNGVAQMARAGELDVPVLALNQVPTEVTPPADLYQFGLSPEDEARQVAERAWLDGHTAAVVLTPGGNWGDRVFAAFANRWERLGGLLAEHQSYNAGENDFSDPIQRLLNIDESKERRVAIQRLLGKKVEFEPRRRQDADFIFLAANAQKARQIRPQLQFHHASGMPTYTTSHIYAGNPATGAEPDLEGLKFPDIPWLLAEEGDEPLSQRSLTRAIGKPDERYWRLYAMGIDSFHLLPHLARLQTSPRETLDGKTGSLYLDRVNQVHRQLVWAEIRKGVPSVIGYAPRLQTDDTADSGLSTSSPESGATEQQSAAAGEEERTADERQN
jgi:outer membrane PBP1 activator LpoA protein